MLATVKESRAFLSVFFQGRGKESSSYLYSVCKGESKAFGRFRRLGRGSSHFLLPPVFLFTSSSVPRGWEDLGLPRRFGLRAYVAVSCGLAGWLGDMTSRSFSDVRVKCRAGSSVAEACPEETVSWGVSLSVALRKRQFH